MEIDVVARHLGWCRVRNLRPNTIDHKRRLLRHLEQDVGPLEFVDEPTLMAWYLSLCDRVSARSQSSELAHVAVFFRWLVRERVRDDDPSARLDRPRLPRRLPRPIPDEDLARALADPADRVRPWLYLAAYAGLRACEIATLAVEDIRFGEENPSIFVTSGKGDRQRIVPMHFTIADELHPYAMGRRRGPLFRRAGGGPGQVRAAHVSRACNGHLHDLGITSTLHQLRHWFGTKVYAASQDIRLTQELMGHADPTTTAGYTAWSQERGATIVGLLPVHLLRTGHGADAVEAESSLPVASIAI